MKRVVIVSDCPTLNTGYARVARLVANSLMGDGYQVRYLPCNANIPDSERKFSFDLANFSSSDRYWNQRIAEELENYSPSLVIVIGEFISLGYIGSVCRNINVQSLYYCPVEGLNYPPHFVYYQGGHIDYRLTLSKFHYIVAYSEFGKNQIHRQLPGIVHDVIPHAVDSENFRPLDREECRRKFFPNFVDNPEIGNEGFFIVGAVYRNQRRKGVDYLLKGFKYFVENYERDKKCFLFLAMDVKDPMGYNVNNYIEYLGLKGRVTNVPIIGGKQGPEDSSLTEIYNTFDVHCCPFRAEGWGLPILEGMACGVPTIITDYATPAEYTEDSCYRIPVFDTEPLAGTNCEWAVLDYKEVGDALGQVYADNEDSESKREKSVRVANKYSEKIVSQKWKNFIGSLPIPDSPDIDPQQTNKYKKDNLINDYLDALES